MRYPTRETAAKIEGYPERITYVDESGNDITNSGKQLFTFGKENDARLAEIEKELNIINERARNGYLQIKPEYVEAKRAEDAARTRDLIAERQRISSGESSLLPGIKEKKVYDYEDILRRYSDFPKQYRKLYKNADIRTVTDPKGNTWYEVDVPEGYLQQEWAFAEGGSMILPKMMMDKHHPDKIRQAIAKIRAGK